jgi:hypothetical protein
VVSVPVLRKGAFKRREELTELISHSNFKSPYWRENLIAAAEREGLNQERVVKETDPSDLMEGLYIKEERNGGVEARYKFIRAGFLQAVLESESHWQSRPILPNLLSDKVDIFESAPAAW